MRTTLDIDRNLLETAVAVLGARSKKQAIETALRESIAQRRRQELLNALGTIDLDLTVEQLHRDRAAE